MQLKAAYLCVRVQHAPSRMDLAGSTRVREAVRNQAERFPGVGVGVASASQSTDDVWTESFPLRIGDPSTVDEIAEALAADVRRIEFKDGAVVGLVKRMEYQGDDDHPVFELKIHPSVDAAWKPEVRRSPGDPLEEEIGELPDRLRYLSPLVNRYYLVGGKDVYAVFDGDSRRRRFLDALTSEEAAELRRAYERIVAADDHHWIVEWACDEAKSMDSPKAVAIYFLVFLDVLREAGLFGEEASRDGAELVDWDRLSG